MGTYFPAKIEIGGKLKRADLDDFLDAANKAGVGFDYADEENIDADKLMAHLEAGPPESLNLYSSSASWGRFENLENWLDSYGLPWIRHSDAYAEYNADVTVSFPDEETYTLPTDAGGDLVVSMSEVKAALEALKEGRIYDAMQTLSASIKELPTVPPFEIVDD